MFKLDLEKEPEIKLPTSVGSSKKQGSSTKISTSALLTMPKPLTVWITRNCEKLLRDGNTKPPHLPLVNLYADKEATEPDMDQGSGSKLRKEHVKSVCCHPALLT